MAEKDYAKLAEGIKKPWLSQEEAAYYCCVSESHFKAKKNQCGLRPRLVMGKIVFSRAELDQLIEAGAWQDSESPSIGAGKVHISTSPRMESGTGNRSARYPSKLQKQLDKLRNSN